MLPTYCIPPSDVRSELFGPSQDRGPIEFLVNHDVRAGDLVVPGGAQLFRDPPEPLRELDGHWTFSWDAGLTWFEEALEVHVHARDPRTRVDVLPSERHVRIELDGELVADSRRPHALFETTLPTRWYLPPDDVRSEMLVPSDTITRCPYKGTASYWSVRTSKGVHRDIAWSYPDPVVECPRIAGLICFYNEKVDLILDGVREARPQTPWSS
ncbi:MAG TPA: DUF427 domain-containing protein [Actinomycetota bacterium]|nr:DUF427 domain-containing protein [Actinomycetota bacterium]